jgi:PhnB protein
MPRPSNRHGEEEIALKLRTFLNFGGNCEEAFRFYERELGGKITTMMNHEQNPGPGNIAPEWKKAILHARLVVGDIDIMASDIPPDVFQPMRSSYLSLAVNSPEEAERIYQALSPGGEVFIPLQETFFATRFAQLRDRFGTLWMILHEKPMGPPQP